MADVNANIGVNIDTSAALAQLKSLQRQISQFHTSISKSSESAAIAQKSLQKNLLNSVNSIGAFSAELRTVKTSAESFTASLEGNKFSMREYFRYAGASTKTFGRLFKSEFDTIGKVAEERVKRLQTQYIKLGRDTNGAMQALAVTPTSLNMNDYGTRTAMAAQKQALFNQLMKQGSTNLLNFGKNTQWAGRQLMVGFTIPLSIVGSAATKTFMDMEAQALKFKKVYGDLFTPQEETQAALDNITELGRGFTKYGIAVSQTVGLASEAAAAGFQGLDLQRQTTEATRLSVLGQIDSQKALETTIALQNAFGMSSENLAGSIDFLNAVENQTVVSLDDITTAIPKVAPVIQQLGGDVKDLTFFIAAMKEGGINASEGANALKSGLAALINPTGRASAMLKQFGINATDIVTKNRGDLKATVIEFATALNQLDPLNRAQAIEQMFGKFQFARLSTLFANVAKDGNQAARVLDLANSSVEDLASLSEKELGMTAESSMNKFKKTVEDLKVALIPVGKAFLEAVTPILEFVAKALEKFGNLSDGTKKVVTLMTLGIAGLGPIFLMTFGLLANLLANAVKGAMILRNGYLRLTGQSQVLGEQTQYLTMEQIEAAAAAHSLDQSHARLTQQFTAEASAVAKLISVYQQATVAGQKFMLNNPGMMLPGARKGYANGVISVPGSGKGDTVPAMLTPGEAVIPADMAKKYAPLISGMIAGNIPGYQDGLERSSASGMVFAHGIAPVNLSADAIKQLSLSVSQSLQRSLSQATRVTGFTNMGFLAPQNLNKGKMSGEEGGQFFKENSELATSRIYKSITDLLPAAASDPNVKKDIILFGQNIGEQLTLAGSKAISDPDFYNAVSNALEKTMTQATTQAFRESMPKIQKQITAIGAFGGEANRGERGQRASLSKISQQRAFGYQQGMVSYKGQTLKSQLAKQGFNQGNQLAMSAVAGAKQGAETSSPSKKTIKIGQDIARGLEVGMNDRKDDVAIAGSGLATAAVGGTQSGRNRPKRAPRTPKASGINLSSVAANMPMNPQTQRALITEAKIRETATQKMQKLDRSLMGASFAVSSLAGMASLSGGKLGAMSGTISKVTGAMFALQAVTSLLTQTSLISLAQKRLEVAGFMGAGRVTGLFSGGIKKLLPNLLRFGGMIARFLGPVGLAISAIAGMVSIVKLINAAKEKERLKTEGLSEAFDLTADKVKGFGDLLGVSTKSIVPTLAPKVVAGPKARDAIDATKEGILKDKDQLKMVDELKKATKQEAMIALQGLAVGLRGSGLAKDQINTIIQSLQELSGKTKFVLNFENIDIKAKGGSAGFDKFIKSMSEDLGEKISKGTTKVMQVKMSEADPVTGLSYMQTDRSGNLIMEQVDKLDDSAKRARNILSGTFKNVAFGLAASFKAGIIGSDEFNSKIAIMDQNLKSLDPGTSLFMIKGILKDIDPELAKTVGSFSNLNSALLVTKAALLGIRIPDGLLRDLQGIDVVAEGLARYNINNMVEKDQVATIAAAKKEFQALQEAAKASEKTPAQVIQEKTKAILDQALAYRGLRAANVSSKTAADLAGDSIIAAAIAGKEINLASKEWKGFIRDLEAAQTKADKVAKKLELIATLADIKQQKTDSNNQIKAYDKLISKGMSAEEASKWIDDIRYVNLINEPKKADSSLQEVIESLNQAKASQDALALTLDPFANAKKSIEEFGKEFDKAMEHFRIQEAQARQNLDPLIKAAKTAVDEVQKEIDKINKDAEIALKPLNDESNVLSNNLAIIDNQSKAINDKYDLQASALQEISEINSEIANQQKQQLTLADALSQGDISAAAAAAQDMRASAAQNALGQQTGSLEAARKKELDSLIVGGMTRAQIEERQYQISQQIYAIEQKRNLDLDTQNSKLEIQKTKLEALEKKLQDQLDVIDNQRIEWDKQKLIVDALPGTLTNINGILKDQEAAVLAIAAAWAAVSAAQSSGGGGGGGGGGFVTKTDDLGLTDQEIRDLTKYEDAIFRPGAGMGFAKGGLVPKYFAKGGLSRGTDTVPAMLTPGEFVMSKSSVDKYGPMLSAMNNPSFKMPKSTSYSAGSSGSNSIVDNSSAMYNYNIGITVPQSNASSGDIANAVISQIKYIDAQRIRGQR